jgi:L-alanine-DL-glutamate epimerase-like enolase superfamily enzyme
MNKITDAQVTRVDIALSQPYTIAYESYTTAETVMLKLKTKNGIVGFGAVTPDAHVTGEDASDVAEVMSDRIIPLLEGTDPLRYAKLQEQIHKAMPDKPTSRALVDMALYDLLGKQAGLPVWRILGGYRSRIETSVTVGILSIVETLEQIDALVSQNIRTVKLKGGIDVEQDIRTLESIAQRFSSTIRLRFDANQGYTEEQTLHFLRHIPEPLRLEILEQPVGSTQHAQLGTITKKSAIPIMADESVSGLRDAFHLVRHNLVDMINIKLMKSGGITNALHINSVARAAGVEVMVGCMDECQLGIAAGLHFALSRPNIRYADLDGFIDLAHDPSAGCVMMKGGYLYPSEKPGFGLEEIM